MSNYIQIPNSIQLINQGPRKQYKMEEIYAYGVIRKEIKDNSYRVSISQEELAENCGWCEKTSWSYIQDLESHGLLIKDGWKTSGQNGHPYNVYKLHILTDDYSIYKPEFFTDPTLTPEQKGLIMLLKSHCFAGTRHMPFESYCRMDKLFNINRITLKKKISELQSLGQISFKNGHLILLNQNILLSIDKENPKNWVYETIYQFCIDKGIVPPLRDSADNVLLIAEQYYNESMLKEALSQKFNYKLPLSVDLSYFAQGLMNKHWKKQEQPKYTFIM